MVAEAVNNIGDNDGDGDKTNGANGNKATGVLSKTGSAVTAWVLRSSFSVQPAGSRLLCVVSAPDKD